MNTGRTWKTAAGLLVLFLLGGVCGATLGTQRVGWSGVKLERGTDEWAERWFAQISAQLELRDEQVATLRPMVGEMQRQLQKLQADTEARAKDIVRQHRRQMSDVLDGEQRKRYRGLEPDNKLRGLVPASQPR